MSAVLLELTEGVATITLNRPEQRNAMSADLLTTFGEHIAKLRGDSDVRAVVITGTGKSFCTGADMSALADIAKRMGDDEAHRAHAMRELYASFLVVETLEVPVIAAINGHAVGGGLGLALACDIRIAASQAKIGANFAKLGIHAGMGITKRLPEVVGRQRAAAMLFTGDLVRGEEAARIGLCLEACDASEVLDRATALARKIASAAPLAVRQLKRSLRMVGDMSMDGVLELEAHAQARLSRTKDAMEGISAMVTRREPKFSGT